MGPIEFHVALMAYCARFQASVTSYGRTATRNAAVGGVPLSRHLVWLAADVIYDTLPSAADRQAAAQQLGLRLIQEDNHDHLQSL